MDAEGQGERNVFLGRYPVSNLTSEVNGQNVTLNWSEPTFLFVEGTFHHHTFDWDSPLYTVNPGAGQYIKAARFTPEQLIDMEVAGGVVDVVCFLLFSGGGGNTSTGQLRIWIVEPGESQVLQFILTKVSLQIMQL
jgi:hypothetical protein